MAQQARGGAGGFGGAGVGRAPARGLAMSSPEVLQQQVDSLRVALAVTNDDEWSVISPRLLKVVQLRAQADAAAFADMLSLMPTVQSSGVRAAGTAATSFGGQTLDTDPNSQALTKAITDDVPIPELKNAMTRVRNAHKQKKDQIAAAQSALLEVVTVRQEAILLSKGFLE
jgi:hypothetical protein